MMALAFAAGRTMSMVVLRALFCFAVTPIRLLGQLTGKRFLESEPSPGGDSYWVKREPTRKVSYEKMC
jgi:hypothetical protein